MGTLHVLLPFIQKERARYEKFLLLDFKSVALNPEHSASLEQVTHTSRIPSE